MLYHQEFGIDLGTDTIKIYDKRNDRVDIEKNMIALRDRSEIVAAGNAAFRILGREPENVKVLIPMSSGKINDIMLVEAILHTLLFEQKHYIGHRPDLFFSVPTDMTEIERRAYASIARRGKLRNCNIYLVEKPVADALSVGITPRKTKGTMIVNIGACGTELSVIASSRVILNRSISVCGNAIDAAIVSAVRRKNSLFISKKIAEELKINCDLYVRNNSKLISLNGIDAASGLPRNGIITLSTIEKACTAIFPELASEIRKFVGRIPPQIRGPVMEEGIILCGGGSHIAGLEQYLKTTLNFPVRLSTEFQFSTINGLREIISHSGKQNVSGYSDKKRSR